MVLARTFSNCGAFGWYLGPGASKQTCKRLRSTHLFKNVVHLQEWTTDSICLGWLAIVQWLPFQQSVSPFHDSACSPLTSRMDYSMQTWGLKSEWHAVSHEKLNKVWYLHFWWNTHLMSQINDFILNKLEDTEHKKGKGGRKREGKWGEGRGMGGREGKYRWQKKSKMEKKPNSSKQITAVAWSAAIPYGHWF